MDVFDYLKLKRTIDEFGNLDDVGIYEAVRSYSPYQQKFPKAFPPIMLASDYDHECAFQTIKFMAKIKETEGPRTVIYKEYPTWTTEEVKKTEELGFLVSKSKIKL